MFAVDHMDIMNALFELFGAFAVLPSILEAHRTKRIMGVSIITSLFFTSWGLWNIFYYPSLTQTWSGYAAILMTATNAFYLWQVYKYRDPAFAGDYGDHEVAEQIQQSETFATQAIGGNE